MCPDEDQILLLLRGTLDPEERGEIESHLAECETCRRLVAVALRTVESSGGGGGPVDREAVQRGASVGRYLVLSLLGRGGMGEVFSAYDPELDRRVAVKLLRTTSEPASARARLVREARALGKLSHPNVVQVHDVGEHGGDVFVAMELVDGQPLDAWCRDAPRPGWREVLAAYLDAARGLSAAHAQGLVHRDVKPSNILRGKDGRVRVADFGLAVGSDEAPPGGEAASLPEHAGGAEGEDQTLPLGDTAPAPIGNEETRLTATGAVVGTPLYMAPEQQARGQATPASDQYSLCAALHEGLYGVRPFAGAGATTLGGLLALKQAGVPASPPAGSPVPSWVYRAVARGLAADPADRHASLTALVAALGEDPEARRRSRGRRALGGLAAAALLVVGAAGWVRSGAFADPCRHPEQQLAGAWDEGVKDRVRAAFQSSGRAYSEGIATRVVALVDRYAAEWSAMRGEVCRASRNGPQRREILALRDLCLDRRRAQLQALTTLFAERGDTQVLDRAVSAASDLYPVSYCADTEALSARVRPPETPALRAQVDALQPRVDQIEALYEAGKYGDGLPLAERLLADAGAIPYPPIVAQIQYWTGRLRDGAGDFEGAKTLLREASVSAAEGRDEVLAALAWARLLFVVGERQRHADEALLLLSLGPTVVAGAHDTRVRGTWLNAEGLALWHAGKYAEAEDALRQCLTIYEEVSAPEISVAATWNNLGLVLGEMGDDARARVAIERGLALREKALGLDHPYVAASLVNRAIALSHLGEPAQARDDYARALGIRERALGPDHPDVALSHLGLGRVLRALGDSSGAASQLARARAIFERMGPGPLLATVLLSLGELRFDQEDYPGALDLFEQARAMTEKALGHDHAELASPLLCEGRTLVHLGRLDAAQAVIDRGRVIREKAVDEKSSRRAEPLTVLAELDIARGAPDRAVPRLERALAIVSPEVKSEVQLVLAEALWQVGKDRARARAIAEEARARYERVGHVPERDRAARWLAKHP
jgi:serine/threonine-protein kinase